MHHTHFKPPFFQLRVLLWQQRPPQYFQNWVKQGGQPSCTECCSRPLRPCSFQSWAPEEQPTPREATSRCSRAVWTKSDSPSEQAPGTRARKCHLFPWYSWGNTILGEDFMDHISAPSFLSFKLLNNGNGEHTSLKKNLLEILLSSRSLKPHG